MRHESMWTPPRPDCPNPSRWHAPNGQATEIEVTELVAAMVRAIQPDLVVETGSHSGQTTVAIGEALAANGHGRLLSVERDVDRAREAAAAADDLPVEVVDGESLSFSLGQQIDMLWLDSGMYTETGELLRVAEYRRFRPYLSSRAVVMVHDTGPKHALAAALDQLDMAVVHLPTPRGVSIGRPR